VWLKAEPEEYMERVLAQGDSRPMSNRDDAMAELKQLIGKREPHYAKSRITLTTTGKTPGEIARLLQTRLQDLTGEGQEPGL
jgi:XRE family aerobic/anaerobic benzoate catabolism transcriptional regulator